MTGTGYRLKWTTFAIAVITIAGTWLRFKGLAFGLPFADSRPDEMIIMTKALGYGSGDFNPHFFGYPSLMSYLLFALYGFYAVMLMLFGFISAPAEILDRFVEHPEPFFLIARSLSALLGSFSVPCLYLAARQCMSKKSALTASLFLAFAYLHIRDSHFGVTDAPMTGMVVMSLIPVFSILHSGRRKHYILAGLFAGLAVSFKYNAGLLALPVFLAHFWSPSMRELPWTGRMMAKELWLAALCMVAAFLMTSPFVALDYSTFLKDFRHDLWLLSGKGEADSGIGWIRHLSVNLRFGVGTLMLVSALAGLILLARKDVRPAAVAASFPVIYYILAGKGYASFARYILPVVPFICLFAGAGVWAVSEYAAGKLKSNSGNLIGVLLALLVVYPAAWRSLHLARLLTQKDTRELAAVYLDKQHSLINEIGWVGTRYGKPLLPESIESLKHRKMIAAASGDSGRLVAAKTAYAERRGGGWSIVDISVGELGARPGLPGIIITEYYPLAYTLKRTAGADEAMVRAGYSPVIRFEGAPRDVLDGSDMAFDVLDAFYLPYSGLHKVERPGPTLTVWSRADAMVF